MNTENKRGRPPTRNEGKHAKGMFIEFNIDEEQFLLDIAKRNALRSKQNALRFIVAQYRNSIGE